MLSVASLIEKTKGTIDRVRDKHFDAWAGGYARWLAMSAVPRARAALAHRDGPRHLLFALCDHYEPRWNRPPAAQALERVRMWHEGYPQMAAPFRDADGMAPRHSFFFPGEEYAPEYLEPLADLARRGFGEVELHVHHKDDTAATLRPMIQEYLKLYSNHGHLSRDPDGRIRYAFIHGNWALANPMHDGRWCGVSEEVVLLHETGCYADFTFPSCPDESQPGIVNRIYWPEGDLSRARCYERGTAARVGERRVDRILMIEGPLSIARRPGNLLPTRIENGGLTGDDPPSPSRVRSWVSQGIGVVGQPDWVFVKVYTHGAPEKTAASLLGEGGRALHTELTTRYNDGKKWRLHYVTAREMYNVAIAAMDGRTGDPGQFRDYALPQPPLARA
jgi:hypothetical protein